jgi:hypothetical protein
VSTSIAIVICTWNRASSLHATLLSLQQQVAPAGTGVQVIVVDNNPGDDTKSVVTTLDTGWRLGRLRYGALKHPLYEEALPVLQAQLNKVGVPVFATRHLNQRAIIEQGIFVDMPRPGALSAALRETAPEQLRELGRRGREVAVREYDLEKLRQRYVEHYRAIAAAQARLPRYNLGKRLGANAPNSLKRAANLLKRYLPPLDSQTRHAPHSP